MGVFLDLMQLKEDAQGKLLSTGQLATRLDSILEELIHVTENISNELEEHFTPESVVLLVDGLT